MIKASSKTGAEDYFTRFLLWGGLSTSWCLRLDERRERLCLNTLKRIEKGGPLSKYVSMTRGNTNDYDLRNSDTLTTIKFRTGRYRRSFFPSILAIFNTNKLKTTLN